MKAIQSSDEYVAQEKGNEAVYKDEPKWPESLPNCNNIRDVNSPRFRPNEINMYEESSEVETKLHFGKNKEWRKLCRRKWLCKNSVKYKNSQAL